MSYQLIFCIILGCLFMLGSVVFRFLPIKKWSQKQKQGFIIEEFISGIYCFVIAALSWIFKFNPILVMELAVFGVAFICLVVFIPVAIISKLEEIKKNNQE